MIATRQDLLGRRIKIAAFGKVYCAKVTFEDTNEMIENVKRVQIDMDTDRWNQEVHAQVTLGFVDPITKLFTTETVGVCNPALDMRANVQESETLIIDEV